MILFQKLLNILGIFKSMKAHSVKNWSPMKDKILKKLFYLNQSRDQLDNIKYIYLKNHAYTKHKNCYLISQLLWKVIYSFVRKDHVTSPPYKNF